MSIKRTRNKQIVLYSQSGVCLAKRRNKRTQTQKNTYCIIPFIQRSKKRNTIEFRNINLGGKYLEKTKEVTPVTVRTEVIYKDQ